MADVNSDPTALDLHAHIRREQVRHCLQNLRFTYLSATLCAIAIVIALNGFVPPLNLALWASLFALLTAVRYVLYRRFTAIGTAAFDHERWTRRITAITLVAGVVWGLSFVLIFPHGAAPRQGFLLLVVGAVVAGGTAVYAALLPAAAVFITVPLAVAAARFFLAGGEGYATVAVLIVMYAALMLFSAWNNHRAIVASIRTWVQLAYENAGLVRHLSEAKAQAESATKLKDKFVSLVSHDLKSPLTSIKGMLVFLKEQDAQGLAKARDSGTLEKMANSAEGLLHMINQLLNIGRLRSGAIAPDKRFVNLRSLVAARINGISHLAAPKGISLHNELPVGGRVFADPELFGQVVLNLLSNAVKFTPPGGTVTVFSPPGMPGTVAVRDDGVGIAPREVENLFKTGALASTYGTAGEKGAGLGLPYSYDVMRAHGGSLTVESHKGEGSVLYASLPENRAVILIVDDQEVQRDIMKDAIREMGDIEVVEAASGHEALEKLRSTPPHLVITDISMPDMDGTALLKTIRRDAVFSALPVIVLTAHQGVSEEYRTLRENLFSLGASDILHKPVSGKEFADIIRLYVG